MSIDIKALGIDPMMGGAAQLIQGQIASSASQLDEDTGSVSMMVEVIWLGGSQYFFVDPSEELGQLPVKSQVLIAAKQKKGKKGFYNDRDTPPRVVLINGKAA